MKKKLILMIFPKKPMEYSKFAKLRIGVYSQIRGHLVLGELLRCLVTVPHFGPAFPFFGVRHFGIMGILSSVVPPQTIGVVEAMGSRELVEAR